MKQSKPDALDVATDTYWGLLTIALALMAVAAIAAVVLFAPYLIAAAAVAAALLYLSYRIGHRWLGFSRIEGEK